MLIAALNEIIHRIPDERTKQRGEDALKQVEGARESAESSAGTGETSKEKK